MDDGENVFPMDITGSRRTPTLGLPAQGYLVVILADAEVAGRAEAALVADGIRRRRTSSSIRASRSSRPTRRTRSGRRPTGKVVGAGSSTTRWAGTSTWSTRERVVAPCGCVCPTRTERRKALRTLADFDYLHARYYGDGTQHDFHIS